MAETISKGILGKLFGDKGGPFKCEVHKKSR
jgi:hypothetical protein